MKVYGSGIIVDTLRTVLEAVRVQIIKDLMTLIFGMPSKQAGRDSMSELHSGDYNRLEELVGEASCGSEIFSVSSPKKTTNANLEYNRIQLRKLAEKGKAAFKVTCGGVEITLPDDPGYLFSDAPIGSVASSFTTPQQAFTNCINYVANQTQKKGTGSGEATSKSNEKSFSQMLVEKLVGNIVTLIKPVLLGINTPIPGTVFSNGFAGLQSIVQTILIDQGRPSEADSISSDNIFPPNSCDILSNWGTDTTKWSPEQNKKAAFFNVYCNMALNAVIGFLISFLLKEIRGFIVKFLAKRAENKARIKIEKLKQKFSNSKINALQEKAKKVATQAIALEGISKVLDYSKNNFV